MPQGKLKTKVKVPSASAKKKSAQSHKKGSTLKKGGRSIKPKKANLIAAAKLKKNLTQAVNKSIETEVVLKAGRSNVGLTVIDPKKTEGKSFIPTSSGVTTHQCSCRLQFLHISHSVCSIFLLLSHYFHIVCHTIQFTTSNFSQCVLCFKFKMNEAKCLKKEDDLSSSDDDNDEEEMIVDGRVIDVDFEGFSPSDEDFDGIKQLLVQLFSSNCKINISLLAEALIKQNFIGTVLKQSESPDDSDSDDACVYGLVTCYSLTRDKDDLTSLLINYFTEHAAGAPINDKDAFIKVVKSSTGDDFSSLPSCLGFIFNERFVNVPPQAAVPMFDNLLNELKRARGRQHKSRFDFTHYLMICKVYEDFDNFKGKASKTPKELFVNAEEEFFAEESLATFTYNVDNDDAMKKRKVLLLTQTGLEKAVSKLQSRV